jgi:GT2 family glycosyltransferase
LQLYHKGGFLYGKKLETDVIDIKYTYVCIANNDIEVGSNWIAPVLEAFKNDNLPASNHDSYNNYEDFLTFKSTGIAKPKKLLPGSCLTWYPAFFMAALRNPNDNFPKPSRTSPRSVR